MSKSAEKKYGNFFAFWFFVFLVGGIGGAFLVKVFLPWLAGVSPFDRISWLENFKDGTTIINKTEKIYLNQDTIFQEGINKVLGSTVAIYAERKDKKISGSTGLILTNDGLVVTAGSYPAGAKFFVLRDNKRYEAQVLKEDKENNLLLLKIAEVNLPVVALGDISNLKVGETIFSADFKETEKGLSSFAFLGFVNSISPNLLISFLNEQQLVNGCPLANNKGEVFGLIFWLKDKIQIIDSGKIGNLLK